jgi:hypothetical protein
VTWLWHKACPKRLWTGHDVIMLSHNVQIPLRLATALNWSGVKLLSELSVLLPPASLRVFSGSHVVHKIWECIGNVSIGPSAPVPPPILILPLSIWVYTMPRSGASSWCLSILGFELIVHSAMMIATWINSMLWALEIVQVIRIWKCVCLSVRRMSRVKSLRRRNYPKDPLMIRGIMLACLTFDTACTCAACATVYLVSFPYSSSHRWLTALQVLHHQLGQPTGTRSSILDLPFVHHHHDDDRNHCAVVPRLSLLVTVSVLRKYVIDHAHARSQNTKQGVGGRVLYPYSHRSSGWHIHNVHHYLVPHVRRTVQEHCLCFVSFVSGLIESSFIMTIQAVAECNSGH